MLDRIKALMAARQLSPSQFADQTTLPRPVVSHILSGRNKPSLEVAQKIMNAFPEVSADWLLNGRGEMVSTPTPAPPPAEKPLAPPPVARPVAPTPPADVDDDADATDAAPPPPVSAPPRARPVKPAVAPPPPTPPTAQPAAPPATPQWDEPIASPPVSAPGPPVAEPLPAIAAALAGLAPAALPTPTTAPAPTLTRPERVVRRILVFYSDGSFSDHRPLPPEENPFL